MPNDRAFLVIVRRKNYEKRSPEDYLTELSELTRSAGGFITGHIVATVERPTPNYFISSGKLLEARDKARQAKANILIFNIDLSPIQGRNIESETGIRAVDRTGLIIDIFARRAQSRAGRLQVELAQLNYLLPRLVGQGVIMSRTGGGIGTRGPGEQKLEVDRRKIRNRIIQVKKELGKVKVHQDLLRKRRQEKDFPLIAIVGYTNAGKSTLMNALTGSQTLVEDKLFATLDPTTRLGGVTAGARLNEGGTHSNASKGLLFTDTVGFLVDLPHSLIEAFQATLDEVREADVLIHVMDVTNSDHELQFHSVGKVLEELGAHEKPIVLALNKIDGLDENQLQSVIRKYPDGVPISAKSKLNLKQLIERVYTLISKELS